MPPVTEQSDSALVELTRAGDTEAFAELWRRHARAALTVARSHTSTFDADDLISEAYAKIYQAIAAGGGPTTAFRAYLFTTIRNIAASWGRAKRETAIDELDSVEDPAFSESATMEALDRSLTAKAFHSLPTRWQEVLWYCEVERMTPQQVAPLFAMTPNAVAALAYRAREGLRQAWVQAHIATLPEDSECRWTTERLGSYARNGLGKREKARVDAHLADCAKCTIVASEAHDVGSRLALVLLPLTLGIGGAAAYSAWLQSGADAAAYAIGESGAVVPGSAAPATSSGAGSSSGAATGVSGTGAGNALGIGLSVTGVLVAAAVVAGFVFGPQLFAPASDTVAAAGAGAGRTAPSSLPAAPTAPDAATAPSPTAPAPEADAPSPVLAPAPVDSADRQQGQTPGQQSPVQQVPVQQKPSPGVPSTPAPTEPPVTAPPAAPAVSSPAGSTETASTALPASGTAAPDARIAVTAQRTQGATGASLASAAASAPGPITVGTTTADAAGAWELTLDLSALGDGDWTLGFVQTTAAGASAAQSVAVLIDRTAEPPVLNAPDTGAGASAGLLAPILTGTAEPGATVQVYDGDALQATVTASDDGAWTSGQLTGVRQDFALTARQTDRLGNVSDRATPRTGSVSIPGVALSASAGMTFLMTVDGTPGATVQLYADGSAMRNILRLDPYGRLSARFVWLVDTSVDHRFGMVYVDGDRRGLLADQPLTLR
ncbi:sigma-70 family RNA polymerase sigma factor [Leifsonia sp. NPDC102414]|uniref:sigma-70 family RNA polymerase sigma factor n=1 Tax=Leifsonia sp. NPDC102414 TaxID=3364124 RepID=UPI00381C1535